MNLMYHFHLVDFGFRQGKNVAAVVLRLHFLTMTEAERCRGENGAINFVQLLLNEKQGNRPLFAW
ncbi:MAG: hypothetical protein R2795_09865 [Saprospiraceae bacterium]